jgi:hypothetical protein
LKRAGEQEALVNAIGQYFPITTEHRGDTEIVLAAR